MTGLPEAPGQSTTVRIPKTQLFSPASLLDILGKISQGIPL